MIAFLWLLGTAFLAVIIHIGAVLAIPTLASDTAWQKLYARLEPGKAEILPPVKPGQQVLDQMDPSMIVAVCRYDLAEGPLQLTLPKVAGYWSLSFVTPDKTTIYSVNDRTAGQPEAGIYAVSAQEAKRFYAELPDGEALPLVVEASADQGVAVYRLLADTASLASVYRGLASEFACTGSE